MTQYELYTLLLAALSFIIAGTALGWNIFRDCIDRPKLKINIYVADIIVPDKGKLPQVVSVAIANIGNKPIVIKGHGFRMKNQTQVLFSEATGFFNRKKLEPYDPIDATFSHEILINLIEKADELEAFFIYDTTGKEWHPRKKVFKEFKESLLAKKAQRAEQKSSI